MCNIYEYIISISNNWYRRCIHRALYLHRLTYTVFVQVSHFTVQHHWNLQLHLVFNCILYLLYPRLQHKELQEEASFLPTSVLHLRPLVPIDPAFASISQYDGDFLMYTSCRFFIFFPVFELTKCVPIGFNLA